MSVKLAKCSNCDHQQKIVVPTKWGFYRCEQCRQDVPEPVLDRREQE